MELVAVSRDPPDKSRELAGRLGLEFPLLSDPEGDVIKRWGVFDEENEIARPASFLVEPGGEIAYRYVGGDKADRPETRELLERAGEL